MLYIHQYPDWTDFRFDTDKVLEALGQTRLAEGTLLGMTHIGGFRDKEAKILAEDIIANYAIDGIPLEAVTIENEVERMGQGSLNFVKNHIGALQNSSSPLTEARLFNWHAAMAKTKDAKYRSTPGIVQSGNGREAFSFEGANAERIPQEMLNFVKWFETSPMDGVIKAAIAHFWILTIRPFAEANGRVARTLTAMQLARAEKTTHSHYALNAQINKNKSDYFRILSQTQVGSGDLTEWILWFLKMLRNAIKESEDSLAQEIKQTMFRNKHAGETFSSRENQLMEALMKGTLEQPFTAKQAAAIFGTSHDTALREIQSLIEKGALQANKKGGRSQRYSMK